MIKNKFLLTLVLMGSMTFGCNDKQEPAEIESPGVEFKKEGEIYLTKPTGDTIRNIDVEIADSDYERETGLMNRHSMEDNQGMLFIFEEEAQRGFYMKNTYISLDLIFFSSDQQIVNIHEDAEPLSEETIPSREPAQYVLEINAGLSQLWNLQVGDNLILKPN